jgi:hypothetical protein
MHFALDVCRPLKLPSLDDLAPSAAGVATRAAVDIALLDKQMARLTGRHPGGYHSEYRASGWDCPDDWSEDDSSGLPVEEVTFPSARVMSVSG